MLHVLVMLTSSVLASADGLSVIPTPRPMARPAGATQFTYDAVEPKNQRKAAAVKPGAEDLLLDPTKRSKLTANARDLARNSSIVAWAIRQHLNYVATFEFRCRTGDDAIDEPVEALMENWARPYNCDAAGRHSLAKMIRLVEARAIIDGDVGLLKLANGQLQAIEGDRVRDPMGQGPFMPADPKSGTKWVHGVKTNEAGRALAYAIHRRTGLSSYEFERSVSAGNICWHGYYERFDQVRGISPIASALNQFRDLYEAMDYALLKAKVVQLFALAFYRDADDSAGALSGGTDENGDEDKSSYEVDFGRGPIKLDLNPGDRAEFLESKHPSTEFQQFTNLALMIALKSLDIDFSLFDSSHTNFYGSRAAQLHYERSCAEKRRALLDLLNRITVWRLGLWIADGELVLPAGATIGDITFDWSPQAFAWWDPVKDVNADMAKIQAGLDTPQRITKERGRGDWYDNIDQIAEALKYAEEHPVHPVPVSFAPPPAPATVEVEGNA